MSHRGGRYFSGDGDRVSLAVVYDEAVRSVLGLERAPGIGYQGMPIGKPINTMSYDRLDPTAPEFTRFSLQQIYFPATTNILADAAGGGWFGVERRP